MFCFFKPTTAYEMRISDWSSDVFSSDLERRTYFYVPKVANPGTTTSNYDKYRITSSTSATSYNGGVVLKLIGSTTIASGTIPSISGGEWSSCIRVPAYVNQAAVTITYSGSSRADLSGYRTFDCCDEYNQKEATTTIINTPNHIT